MAQRLEVCPWCVAAEVLEEGGVQEDMELLLPVNLRTAADGGTWEGGLADERNLDRRSLPCLELLEVDDEDGTLVAEDEEIFIF